VSTVVSFGERALVFIVVIGILILVHELGHFFVARWTGVGVERFSIGFGPVLLRWRGRETEYCLSAIPMGGYVKMMGEENPLEGGGGPVIDADKAFAVKPLWARFLIVFAGPGMNFVLAAVIVTIVLATVGRPVWAPVAGRVVENGPAAAAGLRSGDRIVSVDGRTASYWEDVDRAIASSEGRPLRLEIERDSARQPVVVTPRQTTIQNILKESREVWDIGAGPHSVPMITSVGPNSPAEAAGLRPGDVVVSVAGQRVYAPDDLVQAIRSRPRQKLALVVERDGAQLNLTVTPNAEKDPEAGGEGTEVGRIQAGIGSKPMGTEAYNPAAAVWHGVAWTVEMTIITVKGLWRILLGIIDRSNIGGPIQIASMAGQQAREGLGPLALFTAAISVNLAVLNLLPVPMLDGGHLLFFVIEAILGRPLSVKKREAAQQVGLALLLLLMVFAIYNDLVRIDAFKIFR
jgi:regulator of sigma E protease